MVGTGNLPQRLNLSTASYSYVAGLIHNQIFDKDEIDEDICPASSDLQTLVDVNDSKDDQLSRKYPAMSQTQPSTCKKIHLLHLW